MRERLRALRACVVLCVALAWCAAGARADVIAYDGFSGPPGATVLGQGGGTGWAGTWTVGGFNAFNNTSYVVEPGSLSYPGLATTGNHASTPSGNAIQGVTRSFATPLGTPGTTAYVSVLLQPEGTLNQGVFNGFFGIYLNGGASNDLLDDLFFGKPGGNAINEYVVEHRGGAGQLSSGVDAVVGETALLVVKAEFLAGNDRFTFYVNPTPGGPEPTGGVVKTDLDLGVVTGVTLYSTGAHDVDEIRVGTTFADVVPPSGDGTPVPLPGVAWAGMVLLGGIGARRWKNRSRDACAA